MAKTWYGECVLEDNVHPMLSEALETLDKPWMKALSTVESSILYEFIWNMREAIGYLKDALDVEECPMLHAVTIDEQLDSACMYERKALEQWSMLVNELYSVNGTGYIPF